MDYRDRLRALREDHDLSQEDVGKVLNKSQQGYSHIENGRAQLSIDDLVTLCKFYEVSADYVIGTEYKKSFPESKRNPHRTDGIPRKQNKTSEGK